MWSESSFIDSSVRRPIVGEHLARTSRTFEENKKRTEPKRTLPQSCALSVVNSSQTTSTVTVVIFFWTLVDFQCVSASNPGCGRISFRDPARVATFLDKALDPGKNGFIHV